MFVLLLSLFCSLITLTQSLNTTEHSPGGRERLDGASVHIAGFVLVPLLAASAASFAAAMRRMRSSSVVPNDESLDSRERLKTEGSEDELSHPLSFPTSSPYKSVAI